MMTKVLTVSICVGLIGFDRLGCCAIAGAETLEDQQAADQTEKVEPTYLRIQGPGLPGDNSAHAQTRIIDSPELQLSADLASDELLRTQTNANFFRRSASIFSNPTTQGVTQRGIGGSGASRSLVLLDGLPLNDPFGGWVYWSRTSAGRVRRIAIDSGLGNLHYSSLALSGTVSLTGERPIGNDFEAQLLAGNLGTHSNTVEGTKRLANTAVAASAHTLSTEGYHPIKSSSRGAIDRKVDAEIYALNAAVTQALPEQRTIGFHSALYSEDKGGGTVLTGSKTELAMLAVSARDPAIAGGDLELNAFWQIQQLESAFSSQEATRAAESPALDQEIPSMTAGSSAGWETELTSTTDLLLGADIRWVSGETDEDFLFNQAQFRRQRLAGGSQLVSGYHGKIRQEVGDKSEVNVALRLDYWRQYGLFNSIRDRSTGEVLSEQSESNSSEVLLTPRFSAETLITSNVRGIISLYHTARTPTLNEVVRPFRVRNDTTLANADLDPEKLYGIDATMLFASDPDWQIGTTIFHNFIEDQIVNVTKTTGPSTDSLCGSLSEGAVCRRRENIAWAQSYGLELDALYSLSPVHSLGAKYFLTFTNILSATQQQELEGKELAQIPTQRLTLRYSGQLDRFRWYLATHYSGAQFEDDLNTLELADYLSFDASLRWRLFSNASLVVQADNIFSERIQVAKTAEGLVSEGAPALLTAGFELNF